MRHLSTNAKICLNRLYTKEQSEDLKNQIEEEMRFHYTLKQRNSRSFNSRTHKPLR
mgnify:CR=1 FL=1